MIFGTQTQTVMKVRVKTTHQDIVDAECRKPLRCMERNAVTRALIELFGLQNKPDLVRKLHVRVDAGHIKWNWDGWRWDASTPPRTKDWIIRFDAQQPVSPHSYTLKGIKTTRIVSFTRERQDQINAARQKRVREGRPDKVSRQKTLHDRVVGFAPGN
jgi:hypothetical protein